jgi:hypothetical protein
MPQYLLIYDLFKPVVCTRQCVAFYGVMITEKRIGKETEGVVA